MNFLKELGIEKRNFGSSTGTKWLKSTTKDVLKIISPVDGKHVASVYQASEKDYEKVVTKSHEAFLEWRKLPAPKRGEVVRAVGDKLREYKDPLGKLVTYEMGKSIQEGWGEVQEIDLPPCRSAHGNSSPGRAEMRRNPSDSSRSASSISA